MKQFLKDAFEGAMILIGKFVTALVIGIGGVWGVTIGIETAKLIYKALP